jgi:hypothetical protein
VCIGVLFVGSLALASGRPFYAPYIDVFGDANANATATSGGAVLAAPPPPPSAASGRRKKRTGARKFGFLFG